MAKYSATDIYFSDDGDIILSSQKDIESTDTDPLRSLLQGIKIRLNYRKNEWPGKAKDLGAGLSDFYGKTNTKETGELVKIRVINELTKGGFISINDLFVDVFPTSNTQMIIKVLVKTSAGIYEYNSRFSLREGETSMNKGKV